MPGLTVLVAYLLMLASIAALFLYINHANSLRAAGLIDLVGDNLHEQLDRRYPRRCTPRDMVLAPEPGIVTDLDHPGLVAAARDADCMLEMVPMMGDFVPAGAPLFRVHGDPGRLVHERVAGLVILAAERTHGDDPAYGFRKLVDIAERGLAQPFTDPTTAVMVIDRLHDCLRQLATRTFPSGRHHDADGDVRLIERTVSWEGYVRLAFDELRLAGTASPHAVRRMRAALEPGVEVDWDAEISGERIDELIAWRSVSGATVKNSGEVEFRLAPGGRGTEVRVRLTYDPPAGKLGAAVAKLLGEAPDQQVRDDLRRFKQMLETGEVVRSEGSPEGTKARRLITQRPAQPVTS